MHREIGRDDDGIRNPQRHATLRESVLEHLSEAVVVTDAAGALALVNPAAREMFDLGSDDHWFERWLGMADFFLADRRTEVPLDQVPFIAALQGRVVDGLEIMARSRETKAERWYSFFATPLIDAAGVTSGTLTVARDITQEKVESEGLQRELRAAMGWSRGKSDFFAGISHEIRTPMNAVIGAIDILCDSELSVDQQEICQTAREAGHSLLAIIDDVLDFSRIESGAMEVNIMKFSLNSLLAKVLKGVAPRAHFKNLELIPIVDPTIPDALLGDPLRLRQILMNLVGNAVKFTREGEVVLRVVPLSLDSRGILLNFEIHDTGPGIAEAKLNSLFEPFGNSSDETDRNIEGTGMGLALSKRLACLMGGDLEVRSEKQMGTTCRLTLKLKVADDVPAETELEEVLKLDKVSILVVDPHELSRRSLCDQLSHWGMRPVSVGSRSAALEKAYEAARAGTPFSLILIDETLGADDGFRLAARLKQGLEIPGHILMLVRSTRDAGITARCRKVGAKGYLTRPLLAKDMAESLIVALSAPSPEDEPAGGREKSRSTVLGGGRILLVEDNPINQRLAARVLQNFGYEVVIAHHGEEAVNLVAASHPFGLVLMDVQMPRMDGYEATRKIRRLERGSGARLPIIAITAHALAGDRERCLDAGMDDYIAKPFKPDHLHDVIEHWIVRSAGGVPTRRLRTQELSLSELNAASHDAEVMVVDQNLPLQG